MKPHIQTKNESVAEKFTTHFVMWSSFLIFGACLLGMPSVCSSNSNQGNRSQHEALDRQAAARLAGFIKKNRIDSWPKGEGPLYDRDTTDIVVGLRVDIHFPRNERSPPYVRAPWCGDLHVPYMHKVLQWPEEIVTLLSGKYVIAAKLITKSGYNGTGSWGRELIILDVLGSEPDNQANLNAALDLICSPENVGPESSNEQRRFDKHNDCPCPKSISSANSSVP